MAKQKCYKETQKRSIAKTISWRACATCTTMAIVYLFTHKAALSLGVGVVEVIAKICLYYFHERIWHKLSWGCAKHPLSDIPVHGELAKEDISIIQNKLKELGYMD